MESNRLTGTLTRIDGRGFGFIHTKDAGDFFVHVSEMRDRKDWEEGVEVTFTPGEPDGRKAPPATDVEAI